MAMIDKPKKRFSLYLSQLPFDLTKEKLTSHFKGKGIVFDSKEGVRLVDKGEGFKGIAFIDVGDATSFKKGLKLHRSRIDGRQINVRPTLKPEELEKIVELREEKLQDVITKSIKKRSLHDDSEKGKNETDGDDRPLQKKGKNKVNEAKKIKKEKTKLERKPEMKEALENREKWTKSKRTRERLKLKRIEKAKQSAETLSSSVPI